MQPSAGSRGLSPESSSRLESATVSLHQDLIDRCVGGDREAHYQLYKLYSKAMYNTACRITNDPDDAEDVLQEAFISAFRNLKHFRQDATFGSWLKKIVINKAINFLKKKRTELLPGGEDWDVAEVVEEEYAEPLTLERVKRAIGQLPDGYRSVLSLYLLEGYDHQEIGQILGITESTSKSQFNRSKKKLRELLNMKEL
jgi:RNA polymerase sigma-70 factor (ECF subfamily)